MIRLICFDVDDTLMDFHKGEKIAFFEVMERACIKCDESVYACYSDINEKLWKALEEKKVTKDELRILRFSQLVEKMKLECDAHLLSEWFVESLAKQCFLIDGSEEVVRKCAALCKVAVATNGIASVQRGRLQRSHLESYFSYCFISEEMGCDKPHPDYFNKIFKTAEVQPQEVLFVGDSLTADMRGSVQSGCVSVWYNPKHSQNNTDVKPDFEIDHLNEVLEIWEELK